MTHDELLIEINRRLEIAFYNGDPQSIHALRAVVELHKPATRSSFTNNDCICMLPNKKCATIQVIEKELS